MATRAKRIGRPLLWILTGFLLYLATGVLFPVSLCREFGLACYTSALPGGGIKQYAGLADYAWLYPQMVLYPPFWFVFAAASVVVALNAIHQHGLSRENPIKWRLSWAIPLLVFLGIAVVAALAEGRNPTMMLFEISPHGQQELAFSALSDDEKSALRGAIGADSLTKFSRATLADLIVGPIIPIKCDTLPPGIGKTDNAESSALKLLNQEVFTESRQHNQASASRIYYLMTVAGIMWAVLATFLCCFLVAAMPKESLGWRRALFGTIGAVVALMLWFPHRIYFNAETKAHLFPAASGDAFDFWIPPVLQRNGITGTEAIPLALLIICAFVICVLIFKKDPAKMIKSVAQALGWLGITGTLIWAALDPNKFGPLIGFGGKWDRFTIVTCFLAVLFVSYLMFAINQDEPQARKDSHQL